MTFRAGSSSTIGYAFVRVCLGSFLLVAAAAKGFQLATEPTAQVSLMTSRWFLVAVVEFEILLGLCLLADVYTKSVWRITLGCFLVFACASAYRAFAGEASCGCSGSVEVNPWLTLCIDVVAVFALLRWRPAASCIIGPAQPKRAISGPAIVASLWLLAGLPAAWGAILFETSRLDANGGILGDGKTAVLTADEWSGKPFPLLPYLRIDADLKHGKWLVLLYDLDCSACRDAFSLFRELAREFEKNPEAPSIALIECPPLAERDHSSHTRYASGSLKANRDWRLPAPVAVLLDEGVVCTVFRSARDADLFRAIWGTARAGCIDEEGEGIVE
jgi:methylamine utilization protein MauE